LFEIQLGNIIGSYPLFRLLPHQRTDPNSILFSAAYLSRLVTSIALNFLHVINYGITDPPSPFFTVMQSDPIQDYYYRFFPIILGLISLGSLINICYYFHGCVSFKTRFKFTSDFMDDQIPGGANLMKSEKEAKLRNKTTLRNLFHEHRMLRRSQFFKKNDESQVPLDDDREVIPVQLENESSTVFSSVISLFAKPVTIISDAVQTSITSFTDSQIGLTSDTKDKEKSKHNDHSPPPPKEKIKDQFMHEFV